MVDIRHAPDSFSLHTARYPAPGEASRADLRGVNGGLCAGGLVWLTVYQHDGSAGLLLTPNETEALAQTLSELADQARAQEGEGGLQSDRAGRLAAVRDVIAERRRQIEVEGWTPEHDDQHQGRDLPRAAISYCMSAAASFYTVLSEPPSWWPWDHSWWKPKTRRQDLVRAGALILAEIERLDRQAAAEPGSAGGGR